MPDRILPPIPESDWRSHQADTATGEAQSALDEAQAAATLDDRHAAAQQQLDATFGLEQAQASHDDWATNLDRAYASAAGHEQAQQSIDSLYKAAVEPPPAARNGASFADPAGPVAPKALGGVTATTVDIGQGKSGGGAYDHDAGLARVYQDAIASGLDEEGARAAVAVAQTEGGMGGAQGDAAIGGSRGTFQLYFGGGQGDNFAASHGLTKAQADQLLAQDPHAANAWALRGYLGNAIREGQRQGLSGAALATYAQQHGQVSVSPERAGQNYQALFSGGELPFDSAGSSTGRATVSQEGSGFESPSAPSSEPPLDDSEPEAAALVGQYNADEGQDDGQTPDVPPLRFTGPVAPYVPSKPTQSPQSVTDKITTGQPLEPGDFLSTLTKDANNQGTTQLFGEGGPSPQVILPSVTPPPKSKVHALLDQLGDTLVSMAKGAPSAEDVGVGAISGLQGAGQAAADVVRRVPVVGEPVVEVLQGIGREGAENNRLLTTPDSRLTDDEIARKREAETNLALGVAGSTAPEITGPIATKIARMVGTPEQAAALRATAEGFVANINPEKFPAEIRPLLERGATALQDFAGQRRGVVPDAEAMAAATERALGTPIESWLKTPPGRVFSQEEALALGQTLTDVGREYNALQSELVGAIAKGANTPALEAKVAQKALEFATLEGVRSGAAAEAGRALRSFQQALTGAGGTTEAGLRQALKVLGGGERFRQFVDEYNRIPADDAIARYQALRGLYTPSLWDRITILRYASMLSSTTTHLTNAVANTIGVGSEIALKPLSGLLDASVQRVAGGERTRYAAETVPQIKGAALGFWTGLKEARAILTNGVTSEQIGKMEVGRPGFQSGSAKLDTAIELPLRALTAADAIFRGAATGGHIAALATRQAIREGVTGSARMARVDEIIREAPSNYRLLQEANDLAARPVVQERRVEIAPLMQLKQNNAKYVVDFFLPFVRTPYNIAAQGAGLTPAGLLGVVAAGKAGNRGEAIDRAARSMVGTAAMGTGTWLAANDYLTGARPTDPAENSTLPPGWQPWSVRIPHENGDATYVEIKNLGPWAIPLAIGAVLGDAYKRGQTPADPQRTAVNAVKAIGSYMRDQTFLQGISNVEKAISDPTRYAENITEGIATSFMPYAALQRQVERALGMAQRDPHGAVEALMASTPLLAGNVRERLTDLGDPLTSTQTGVSAFLAPAKFGEGQDEPTLRVLRDARVSIPQPPKEAKGLPLTEDEGRRVQTLAGGYLREMVAPLDADPEFAAKPLEVRARILTRMRDKARNQAEREVLDSLSDDELGKRRGMKQTSKETRQPMPALNGR